ncbi:stage V sporulation protein B [uncultured Clostridium sp.]|uniref:stage V sporulation protein B n=1 Tax=uncultured Clostridium sp. TaxID=59620 RepID=UPI0026366A66|nr:stage V sporulation protein B [uncultured Clostridium sp.]
MSKDNFYKNSFLLTTSNLATGVLGFIFSIYLSKILGPEGMGLFGLVMPIYNLFISLMTAGIVASISKFTAIYSARNEFNNIFKSMKTIAKFNFIWAFCIGILVFFLSPKIGEWWVRDPRTIKAIMVTCPAMICIALSNILKGYFYGSGKIKIPATIDILEKGIRIIILFVLILMFKCTSLENLVVLVYISICLGEFQSLLLLYGFFKFSTKDIPKSNLNTKSKKVLLKDILSTSIPLCLNGFFISIFATISTLIIPRRLMLAGLEYSEALSIIGRYSGMALTIVTFPLIIIGSLNTLLIPDLSQSLSKNDYSGVVRRIKNVLKVSFIVGICTTILCLCIPNSLGRIFFDRDDLGLYIKIASISMPILFAANTMFGILNGLDKPKAILKNTVIIEIVEISLLFILTAIPSINVLGFAITMFIVSILTLLLNLYEVYKLINIDISLPNIIIYSLTGALGFYILKIVVAYTNFIDYRFQSLIISILVVLLFGLLIFLTRQKRFVIRKR